MISYSGVTYNLTDGAPPLKDVVIHLARLCRWNGATHSWWPVLAHSHIVADILKPLGVHMELAGLTHDLEEGLGLGDISHDLKVPEQRDVQHDMRDRIVGGIYLSQFDMTDEWASPELKLADQQAASAERFLFLDGKSYMDDTAATVLTARFLADRRYSDAEYLDPDGRPVREFVERFEDLVYDLHALSKAASGSVLGGSLAGQANGLSGWVSGCGPRGLLSATGSGLGRVLGTGVLWCSGCDAEYESGTAHACAPDPVTC